MKVAIFILIGVAGVALGAGADTSQTTVADCWKAASSAESGICLRESLPRAEAELERQVAAAQQRFRQWARADESKVRRAWINTAASKLLEAQPAWRRYRDAHCASLDGLVTGNDHATALVRCKLELTTARIKEVMAYGGGYKENGKVE